MMMSKFNGTSTPKGSYSAKTVVNCPMSLKKSPLEKNVMVKYVRSPRQNINSHVEKRSSNEQGNAHYGPWPAKVAG